MPLTPEDVSNKRFTTVRLREGYDMTEVDQFLDEVEAELGRLTRENTELQTKLATATGKPAPVAAPAAEPAAVADPDTLVVTEPPAEEGAVVVAPAPTEDRVPPMESLHVTTTAEASVAAARLLELAGRNADQLVGEAQQEAEQIVSTARTEADRLSEEARARAEQLDAETNQRRETLFGEIEREKAGLDREVENLRTFEREYRAELKSYFEDQLAALEGQGSGGVLGRHDEGAPAEQERQPADQGDGQHEHHG